MSIQVVSLLLLLAASPVLLDENLAGPSPYQKFRKQHINQQMKTCDCDSVISKNEIYVKENNNKPTCKPVNTFILADESEVKSVCENGTPQGKYMKSKSVFNLVVCKLRKQKSDFPDCQYKGHHLKNKYIIIACDNNKLPVHYQGDIRYCDA